VSLPAAVVTGAAVFLLATRTVRFPLAERLAAYLAPVPERPESHRSSGVDRREHLRWVVAGAVGATIGVVLGATGGTGSVRSTFGLAAAGAAGGVLAVRVSATQRHEARRRRLRRELPVAADAIALHVLAGESIPVSLERFCGEADGVVAEELRDVLHQQRGGATLSEALSAASRRAGHPDASRFFDTLAHAHHTGGRLAEGLAGLAGDFRASIERDLVAEGGRRALATYGPILALQIPVTLLFLMYPTLVGLRELSATP
jgi:tight adherence protein C